jgi:hypothetical protein
MLLDAAFEPCWTGHRTLGSVRVHDDATAGTAMSPAKQAYRAPDQVCRFFEALRAAQLTTATGFPVGKLELAEDRGGGDTGWKQHLHHSKFDDIKAGFEFDVWPDHLDDGSETAAVGLYVTGEPFAAGLHVALKEALEGDGAARQLAAFGMVVSGDHPQHHRDRTSGTWLIMRSLSLAGYDLLRGEEFGRLLGGLMNLTRPYRIDDMTNAVEEHRLVGMITSSGLSLICSARSP